MDILNRMSELPTVLTVHINNYKNTKTHSVQLGHYPVRPQQQAAPSPTLPPLPSCKPLADSPST